MGGGDLNSKKSWHPHTLKNQEQVWKAEQAKALEEKKLNDLRKEIQQEREMEDLKRAGRESGVLSGGHEADKKLDWMYKSTHELVNREEYLLGRKIDKSFEVLQAEEQQKEKNNLVGVKQPLNHVEHECVPFSIRAYKNVQSTEQVDLQRKFMEDPLMLIKQREMETRRKILENPVKLKELHKILKTDEKLRKEAKKSKKSKKSKTSKKKHKKRSKSSSSSSSSDNESNGDSDSDIDSKLAKKLKVGLLDGKDFLEKGMNLDKILDSKYEKISQELDKAVKSKKKKKRKESSSDDDDSLKYEGNKKRNHKHNTEYHNRKNNRHESSEDRHRSPINTSNKNRYFNKGRSRSRSVEKFYRRSRSTSRNRNSKKVSRRSRSNSVHNTNRNRNKREDRSTSPRSKRRDRTPTLNKRTHRSRSRSNDKSNRSRAHKDRSRSRSPRNNKDSRLTNRSRKSPRRSRSTSPKMYRKISPKPSSAASNNQRPSGRLTEKEKQERLREMMVNAEWREEERTHAVRKHREDYAREEEQNKSREFDKDFLNKEVKKAIANQTSVGSRLRANLNNIQRTSSSMNDNFIKK